MMPSLKIAPTGTCRLFTPLRRGMLRHQFALCAEGNYGFTHTSSEALQQLRFMGGEITIPERIHRILFRNGKPPASSGRPQHKADLHFIEISSMKRVFVAAHEVQLNYMSQYFREFFSDKARARRFWQLSPLDKQDERDVFLRRDASFGRLLPDDQKLLRDVRVHEMDAGEVAADMTAIAAMLDRDRIVFVTHVNAMTADNAVIPARARLIEIVTDVARTIGARSYDPSSLMQAEGQSQALEKQGLDLAHYTPRFADRLCDDWSRTLLRPLGTDVATSTPAPTAAAAMSGALAAIDAQWAAGDLRGASTGLRVLMRAEPLSTAPLMLFGRVQFELGDFESAVAALEKSRAQIGGLEDADPILMQAHFALGNWAETLVMGRALISDEAESPEMLRCCAIAAGKIGAIQESLGYWTALHASDGTVDRNETASAILAALVKQDRVEDAATWCMTTLRDNPQHIDALVWLWEQQIAVGDRAGLRGLANLAGGLNDVIALTLAKKSAAADILLPAALLVAPLATTAEVSGWIAIQIPDWSSQASALLSSGDLVGAADHVQAAMRLQEPTLDLIRLQRAVVRAVRTQARQLFSEKNFAATAALCNAALDVDLRFPELDSFLGRAAAESGDHVVAMRHLKLAVRETPSIAGQIALAREAVKADHFLEALEAYRAIIETGGPDDAWAVDEARRSLAGLVSRAIRSARAMAGDGAFEDAWALLKAVLSHNPDNELAQREQSRLAGVLRREIAAGDAADPAARIALAKIILEMRPHDTFALKAAGVSAMRLHMFASALGYWQSLRMISEDTSQADSYIAKCNLWIDRTHKRQPLRVVRS